LEKKEPISTMKNMIYRKYFFQKLTKFSKGYNVLNAAASNIDGFLGRDTCVSSPQLDNHICSKPSSNPPEPAKVQDLFLSKMTRILPGKLSARCSCCYHRWFSFKRFMCFFNSA
jgi:hypothetical protein